MAGEAENGDRADHPEHGVGRLPFDFTDDQRIARIRRQIMQDALLVARMNIPGPLIIVTGC